MEATFNKNAMALSIVIEDDDGNELDLALPAKFEVCGRCSGKGSHVNPSVDGHGISPEEFAEDPDFKEAYFSGMYDVTCYECGGERVMAVFDYSRMNDEQKECADRHERSEAYDDAERRSEERFGY